MKYTISTVVGVFATKKDGTPLMTKTGKPYKKATVKFSEMGDKMIGMMVWSGNPDPAVGAILEGEVESREYKGNTYYDFKEAKKANRVAELEFSIANIDRKLNQIVEFLKVKFPPNGAGLTSAGTPVPNFEKQTPEQEKENAQKMEAYEAKQVAGEDDYSVDIPGW